VPVDDAPVLVEVVALEVQEFQAAHTAIRFELENQCDQAQVAMPEEWLRRTLRHLLTNAVRAITEAERNGSQRPAVVVVRTSAQASLAEVHVEDTGKGVRREIRTSLFKRPIDHVGQRQAERSGRGLLLVRHFVEQYGGHVRLDWSEEGQGTRFAFSIPLCQPEAVEA
jgi:signal transduction histidine kinase